MVRHRSPLDLLRNFQARFLRFGAPVVTLALTTILLLGVFLRFYKLDEIGLSGSDSVYYTTIAKAWNDGHVMYQIGASSRVYRPVIFFLFSSAITVLGYTDSAIKTLNAGIDSINIGLVFLIGYLLSGRNSWSAFAGAILYAFLPMAIHMSRIELVHVVSGFMVLVSVLFFLAAHLQNHRPFHYLLVVFSGVFLGLATLTHEELFSLVLGYLLFFFANLLLCMPDRSQVKEILVNSGLLLTATLVVCFQTLLDHKSVAVVTRAIRMHQTILQEPTAFALKQVLASVERGCRFLWDAVLANASGAFLSLLLVALLGAFIHMVLYCWRASDRPRLLSLSFVVPLLIAAYFAGYVAVFKGSYFVRLFLPLMPLLIIWVMVQSFNALAHFGKRVAASSLFFIVIGLLVSNFMNYQHHREFLARQFALTWASLAIRHEWDLMRQSRFFYAKQYSMSWGRTVYEQLKGKVRDDARLLVTPSIQYPHPGRRILQVGYYFGDNAVYLIDHQEPLDELIVKYKIKYVLFTTDHPDPRMLKKEFYDKYQYGGRWSVQAPLQLGASLGLGPGQYTLMTEYRLLMQYLNARKATLIAIDGQPVGPDVAPPKQLGGKRFVLYEL